MRAITLLGSVVLTLVQTTACSHEVECFAVGAVKDRQGTCGCPNGSTFVALSDSKSQCVFQDGGALFFDAGPYSAPSSDASMVTDGSQRGATMPETESPAEAGTHEAGTDTANFDAEIESEAHDAGSHDGADGGVVPAQSETPFSPLNGMYFGRVTGSHNSNTCTLQIDPSKWALLIAMQDGSPIAASTTLGAYLTSWIPSSDKRTAQYVARSVSMDQYDKVVSTHDWSGTLNFSADSSSISVFNENNHFTARNPDGGIDLDCVYFVSYQGPRYSEVDGGSVFGADGGVVPFPTL